MILGLRGNNIQTNMFVTQVIQYLTWCKGRGIEMSFIEYSDKVRLHKYWKAKSFAQGVKSVYTTLTGNKVNKDTLGCKVGEEWGDYTQEEFLYKLVDCMRYVTETVWENFLLKDYICSLQNNVWYDNKGIFDVTEEDELCHPAMYPNWVVQDVQLPTEYKALKKHDCTFVCIVRKGKEGLGDVIVEDYEHKILYVCEDVNETIENVKYLLGELKII